MRSWGVNHGDPSVAGVQEGEILDGEYRVERVLGIGGMGVVVAAHHLQLDERVALKFLLPQSLGDADAVARFIREARAAVKIKSEHVARVTDVGVLPNGAPYMVMEYLEGGDLAAWIQQRGALPSEQAVDFVLQACVALAEAHALGIVHRDLKPANLFCVQRSDGQLSIKVLDFGISKVAALAGSGPSMAMTKTASLMGTPFYMSPEQLRSSKDVDAQTDIWALGVILFELISGRPPFQGDSITELAIKINNEAPPAMRTLRPDVPNELQLAVLKCLEKDRRHRFRTVADLAQALLPFAPKRAHGTVERISGILQGSRVSTNASGALPAMELSGERISTGTLPATGRTTGGPGAAGRPRGKAGLVAGILGALVLLVAIAGSFVVWKRVTPQGEGAQATATLAPVPSPSPSAPPRATTAEAPTAAVPAIASAAPIAALLPSAEPSPTVPAPARGVGTARPVATASPPKRKPVPQAVATVAPTAPTAPSEPPAAKCDPPYYFDANGNRIFKKECL